jgi:hypothetical protein
MKMKPVLLAFCLFFIGRTAFADSTHYYLPQVAVGSFTDTDKGESFSYSTTFVFFNNTNNYARVTLILTGDDGGPLSVNISGLGTNSVFQFSLPSAGTIIYKATAAGNVRVGAATVISTSDIGVSGIYTINDKATGQFVTEVGVQAASLMNNFVIPVQATANGAVTTGLALYNPPDSSESEIALSLKNIDGSLVGTTTFMLLPGRHTSFYITDKFPSIGGTTFSGMLTVESLYAISAVTLRQNAPSTVTYTSIPVVPTTSTQTTFNLAHFADGLVGGALYQTTFMLFNFSTSPATVTLAPRGNDGSPLVLTMTDVSTTASAYTIEPGASKFLQTNATSDAQGAVKITSDRPIGAAALFTQYNSDQSFNTEAGVQDSQVLTDFTLPIDSIVSLDGSETTSDTGVAFFNPDASAISFTPKFLDVNGIVTTSATQVDLPANGHAAYFFNNLFPQLGNIQGSVTVSGLARGISAMTLRMNLSPFSMTTLPVLEGVAPGYDALTSGKTTMKALAGVIAADNTTVDAKLPFGYNISVSPVGAYVYSLGLGIRAFTGKTIYPMTRSGFNYRASLPPGDYTFNIQFYSGNEVASYYWFYTTDPYTINGDAQIEITSKFPTMYEVTGNVTGASSGKIVYVNTDGSGSFGFDNVTGGSYSIKVPPGSYIITYAEDTFEWPDPPFVSSLGTVTVNNDGTTNGSADIEVPANLVELDGTVTFPDAVPESITVTATDSASPLFNISTASATNGSYEQLKVKPGNPYTMSLDYAAATTTITTTTFGGINCGSTSAPGDFLSDASFYSGSTQTTTNTATINTSLIDDPPPAAIFNSERYVGTGDMTYTIPNFTPGSEYAVTLYFMEAYTGITAAGQRLFNVSINGTEVLSAFDVYQEAGGRNIAIARTFNTVADSSGQIVILLSRGSVENPMINGISVSGGIPIVDKNTFLKGAINYTPTDNPVTFADDDAYCDFIMPWVPDAPEFVTISGTVTNGAGAPVSGVTVTGTSSSLADTTALGMTYTSETATTNASGAYNLLVVKGKDYTLTFIPTQ